MARTGERGIIEELAGVGPADHGARGDHCNERMHIPGASGERMNEQTEIVTTSNVSFAPELSLVMPCYNEEACLGETAPALVDAFADEGIKLELVLVDNGSRDRTGQIIDELRARGLPITKVTIAVNRGYGHGIRM